MTPNQRADDIVMAWSSKLVQPLSAVDAIALRSSIAQQIDQAVAEALKNSDQHSRTT